MQAGVKDPPSAGHFSSLRFRESIPRCFKSDTVSSPALPRMVAMSSNGPLILHESELAPSVEWTPSSRGEWILLRVVTGIGYCFANATPQALSPEDTVLLRQPDGCIFRASQLSPMKLHYFTLSADWFIGLLTIGERTRFQDVGKSGPRCRHFPGPSDVAQHFARLCGPLRSSGHISLRLQLLQLFTQALGVDLAGLAQIPGDAGVGVQAKVRFDAMMEQITEPEFWAASVSDLARRCGCSERHLSRLFHERFGQSIRSRQIEYRLNRARQLLESSDAKVIDVALECGYSHLGLFNSMFRSRFGMPPSEWRKRSRKTPPIARKATRRLNGAAATQVTPAWLVAVLCLIGLVLGPGPAVSHAAEPASTPAGTRTFEVHGFSVDGNTLLTTNILDSTLAGGKGLAVTIEQIRQALGSLQQAYRDRGFPTVSVILPPQQLTNGIVKVRVIEARLADIQIVGNRHFSSNNVLRAMPSLQTNTLLNSFLFQQELDGANLNRDRQLYPVLGPGPEPGTTGLTLKVQDRLPLHGRFDLNNQSPPGTPALRMGAAVQYNNLWQLEHQAGFQYAFSPEQMREADTLPGRFFEHPAVVNYSLFYRMPLGRPTAAAPSIDSNTGAPVLPAGFGYDEVSRQFRAPPSLGRPELTFFASRSVNDSGIRYAEPNVLTPDPFRTELQPVGQDITRNEGLGIRLVQPLPEVAHIQHAVSIGLDYKAYRLGSFNTNLALTTITTTNNGNPEFNRTLTELDSRQSRLSVSYLPVSARYDASRSDRLGTTSFGLGTSFYPVGLLDGSGEFRRASYSPRSDGRFLTVTPSLTRIQKLYHDWTLLVRADGQWANEPLLSNEQFGLGGLSGIRGYRDGQEYGDTGWRILLEPRTPSVFIGRANTAPVYIRSSAFLDYGQRHLLDPASPRATHLDLMGTGAAVSSTFGESLDFRIFAAWALLDTPGVTAGSVRLYFSCSLQF